MFITTFLYRKLSGILSVTILKSSFSVWLEGSTNQLLKSKLIISEVSTDAQALWLKQEHVSILRQQAEGIQLKEKGGKKILGLIKYSGKILYKILQNIPNKKTWRLRKRKIS